MDKGYFTVGKLQYHYNRRFLAKQNVEMGDWVDLSGQAISQDRDENDSIHDTAFIDLLNMNDSEKSVFADVQNSFLYYRN